MNVTVTPTETPDRTLPELPKLETSSVPPELATLGGPWPEKLKARTDFLSKARAARSEYERAVKHIDEARAKDRQALADAYTAGGTDPGRKHEAAALREADEAHRKAEGMIAAANRTTREVSATMKSEDGEAAIAKLWAGIEEDQAEIAEAASRCLAAIGNMRARGHLIETIDRTRRGKGFRAIASASVRPLAVSVGGQGVDPMTVLEGLLNGIEPNLDLGK